MFDDEGLSVIPAVLWILLLSYEPNIEAAHTELHPSLSWGIVNGLFYHKELIVKSII